MTTPLFAPPAALPSTASPVTIHTGGNEVSVSYLKDWHACKRAFYWRHAYQWDTGEAGLEPRYPMRRKTALARYAQPLGSAFHAAVAAWRLSDPEGGKYSDEAAMAAQRATLAASRSLFESEDDFAVVAAELDDLTLRYTKKWAGEFPDVRVLFRNDGPQVEKLYSIPLEGTRYVLNLRPDAILVAHGYVAGYELKTAGASRASAAMAELEWSPQVVSETYVLRQIEADTAGVYADLAVKGTTRSTEKFQRRLVTPPPELVDGFPGFVGRTIDAIDETVSGAVGRPVDEHLTMFPMTGMFTRECPNCAFRDLCWNPGRELAALPSFRPRVRATPADEATMEETE